MWASADGVNAVRRRDVLVMTMVDAAHAGVAFLEADYEDDLVEYTTGLADRLVAGEVSGERFGLGRLLPGERKIIATRAEGVPGDARSPAVRAVGSPACSARYAGSWAITTGTSSGPTTGTVAGWCRSGRSPRRPSAAKC